MSLLFERTVEKHSSAIPFLSGTAGHTQFHWDSIPVKQVVWEPSLWDSAVLPALAAAEPPFSPVP